MRYVLICKGIYFVKIEDWSVGEKELFAGVLVRGLAHVRMLNKVDDREERKTGAEAGYNYLIISFIKTSFGWYFYLMI